MGDQDEDYYQAVLSSIYGESQHRKAEDASDAAVLKYDAKKKQKKKDISANAQKTKATKRRRESTADGEQATKQIDWREHNRKYRKTCSADGCTNKVIKGGVCKRHGAKVEHKQCSVEGCTTLAKKGGVCVRHGAKVEYKRCSTGGCTQYAQKGGVCIKHGAKREHKQCSFEGCTTLAKKGGLCIRHGAKEVEASDGSMNVNNARKTKATKRRRESTAEDGEQATKTHHRKYKKICSADGCTNYVVKGGVCKRHGAKVEHKQCSVEGCTTLAKKGGVCVRHGAKVEYKRCSFEGCTQYAQKGGVCIKHGAKIEYKRCSFEGCTNQAKKGGVCIRHGAKEVEAVTVKGHEDDPLNFLV